MAVKVDPDMFIVQPSMFPGKTLEEIQQIFREVIEAERSKKETVMSRSEIKQLRMENERLHSHHSDCKKTLFEGIESANKWRIRAFVAERLLSYLNTMNPFWYPDDLKKELRIQSESLFKRWSNRERWWEESK